MVEGKKEASKEAGGYCRMMQDETQHDFIPSITRPIETRSPPSAANAGGRQAANTAPLSAALSYT